MRKCLSLAILLLLVVALVGCASSGDSEPYVGASITGANLSEDTPGSYSPFEVHIEQAGDPLGIDFRGTVSSGSLRLQLLDAQGQVAWQETVGTGPFAVNTILQPPVGTYQLGLAWDGPVRVRYNLIWKPHAIEAPAVTPPALVPGLGMLAVALGFVAYALRRRLGARHLALGALAWTVSVALKFAWAIPTNPLVYRGLSAALPAAVATPIFDVYVGSLTGIFEVGFVYLALRHKRWTPAPWQSALAFGIGFGAVEALLLSLGPLLLALIGLVSPSSLPPQALQSLAQASNIRQGLVPVVERLAVVWVHAFSGVLIFYALATRRSRWFWLAFAYKTAVDTIAAHVQTAGLNSLAALWAVEGLFVLFGLAGWLGTRWLVRRYLAVTEEKSAEA